MRTSARTIDGRNGRAARPSWLAHRVRRRATRAASQRVAAAAAAERYNSDSAAINQRPSARIGSAAADAFRALGRIDARAASGVGVGHNQWFYKLRLPLVSARVSFLSLSLSVVRPFPSGRLRACSQYEIRSTFLFVRAHFRRRNTCRRRRRRRQRRPMRSDTNPIASAQYEQRGVAASAPSARPELRARPHQSAAAARTCLARPRVSLRV